MAESNCEAMRDAVIAQDPTIHFLLKNLEVSGCPMDVAKAFKCLPCRPQQAGLFSANHGIILADRVWSESEMKSTIRHDLIHAYDMCNFQVKTAKHLACTEVRGDSG